jgi:signal peptidase II
MIPAPKPNALIWLLLSAVVIGLDQWSKAWVLASLPEYQAVTVIEDYWNWYRSYNTGAAFSFLADTSWGRYVFAALAAVISSVLGYWLWRTPRGQWREALPFSLVIGGALGNLIDRLMHGHVVDFIQWHWKDVYYYPSFNIADSALVCGAVALVVFGVFGKRDKTPAQGG